MSWLSWWRNHCKCNVITSYPFQSICSSNFELSVAQWEFSIQLPQANNIIIIMMRYYISLHVTHVMLSLFLLWFCIKQTAGWLNSIKDSSDLVSKLMTLEIILSISQWSARGVIYTIKKVYPNARSLDKFFFV